MSGYIVTKEEVMKQLPIQWKKMSDYLRLGISWKDLLREMKHYAKKRRMKFVGFSVGLKYERGWRAKTVENYKEKWVDMSLQINPYVRSREAFLHICGHELFHFYQKAYLCLDYVDPLIDAYSEACADIVSIKAVGSKKYWEDYGKKHCYVKTIVMMLSEQMKNMSREELIQFITFPKTKRDLRPLSKKIVELLSKADHVKWVKKIDSIEKERNKIR